MTVIRSRWLFLFFRRKMETAELIRLAEKRDISRYENLELYLETTRLEQEFSVVRPHFERIYELASRRKVELAKSEPQTAIKFYELAKKAALCLAPHLFHYFMLYVEWDRLPEKKFYVPRMHVLKPVVDDLQDLADGRIELLTISLPPRVGKLVHRFVVHFAPVFIGAENQLRLYVRSPPDDLVHFAGFGGSALALNTARFAVNLNRSR